MIASLPSLGVGLGFREPFRSELFLHRPEVDFLEITADHYFGTGPAKQRELGLLAEHFTLIPHGLNLSLGSADGLDPDYLQRFAALVQRLQPPWWSEHIAFTRAGVVEIGHLASLPFTREAVRTVCRNIAKARQRIDVPLILENITFTVSLPGAEMTEAEFIGEILEQSDCGLLLDVTNLHANSVNHAYDPVAFLDQLPLERIVQLHFVGGHVHDGVLVDSHSKPTPPAVWDLLETVLRRAPVRGVILERDENLPAFPELLGELSQARELGRRHHRWN